MSGRDENRVFVGGLAWETSGRQLEDAFSRYGKILECVVVADRETGRSRGFGFVTFVDHRAMDNAISDMHGRELDGRVVSVNKAKPKSGDDNGGLDYGRDFIPGTGRRLPGTTDCFKCGRPGHFARECPLSDGGRFSSQFGPGGRGDRVRIDPYEDRFIRGRYGDRDRDARFESSDRFGERYLPGRESYVADRFVEREIPNEYGRDRGYFRDRGSRLVGDRFGSGGPDRLERGAYRDRAGPYDRPRRADHLSSYDPY